MIATPEEGLAAGLKLAAALPVLRWPLAGALLAIAADGLDVVVMNYVDLGGGGIRDYHTFDKLTDLPALATFLAVALRWSGADRRLALALFAARLLGVVLFETTGWRAALLAFPNLFESWFLFVLLRERFLAAPGRRAARAALIALLAGTKLVQEYLIHVAQALDRHNLEDVLTRIFSGWNR